MFLIGCNYYQIMSHTGLNLPKQLCLTESTYRHQANIDDEVVTMEILDTAGQVRNIVSITGSYQKHDDNVISQNI